MAGRLSALLVPLLSAEAAAVDVGPAGSAECPCVNQSSEVYGFGCASHDVNGTEEYPECGDASTAPGWCGDQWCYVKLSECQVTVEPSENYPGLGWSYTTCGYRDSFSRTNITESLRGKTLRVQFLGNTGGWKGNYCAGNLGEACVDQRGFGPVQNFFDLVVGSAGIKVQQISELPEAVYAQRARLGQRSNFDLCIWATGMGFLDLCVASLVMLPRRSDASPFVSLWAEPTILVGPTVSSAEEVTFGQMLSAAFRPFSPELWLALLCVVITCSLVITYFETSQHGQFNDIRSKRLRAAEAVYRALYSLFMCESRFEPQTLGGRIVGLGLAFMCILFVCGYTATLASFLVEERRLEPNVEDLNDAIRLNKRICAHPSHILTLKVHGVPESNIVPMSVRSEILPSIGVEESSICQVGVLSEEDFVSAQATNGGSFCNLQRIGPAVGSHMVGLSVSEKWSRQLSFAIMAAAADGHLQRALRQHHPEDYCTAINLATQNTAEPEALTVQSMAGPFFVTGFFTLVGILAHCSRAALFKTIEGGQKIRQSLSNHSLREVAWETASEVMHMASPGRSSSRTDRRSSSMSSQSGATGAGTEATRRQPKRSQSVTSSELNLPSEAEEEPKDLGQMGRFLQKQQNFMHMQQAEQERTSEMILRRLQAIEEYLHRDLDIQVAM